MGGPKLVNQARFGGITAGQTFKALVLPTNRESKKIIQSADKEAN
jgi:hypothetical protein